MLWRAATFEFVWPGRAWSGSHCSMLRLNQHCRVHQQLLSSTLCSQQGPSILSLLLLMQWS